MELSVSGILLVATAGLIAGFAKSSVGALGVLAVPLMALAFPAKDSVGVLLPMLIMADVFAVFFYRRHCDWKVFFKIFPITAVGVVIGYYLMDKIPSYAFSRVLGALIISMVLLEILLSYKKSTLGRHAGFTFFIGIAAGITTMLANAAGPLFAIYLLQLGLPKEKFVGTRSWYFLLLNCFKLPFAGNLNIITWETLKLNIMFLPVIFIGALLGYKFLIKINMQMLKIFVRFTATLAGLKFIFF